MRRFLIPGVVFLFVCCSTMASGQTNLPLLGTEYGVGVRAIAMGGAFVGIANDYSATYWNPAGLGQIRRMELIGSFNSLGYQSDTEYFGNPLSTRHNFTNLNAVGYVFPIPTVRGSLVFAIGYNKVANYNRNFTVEGFNDAPDDSVYQQGNQFDRGGLNQWSFAGSIQMSEHLYLGGSLNFWTGQYNYTWELNEWDDLDLYQESQWQLEDEIDTKISGYSLKFAALYNLYNRLRFGATVETPIRFIGKEDWSSTDRVDYDDNTYWDTTSTGVYEYKIRKPATINLGASISLPLLTISGDVSFTDWTQLEYTDPSELKKENRDFLKIMEAKPKYRLGAELTLPLINTRFRAGYILEPSPFRSDLDASAYGNHTVYSDKNFITAGAGFLLDRNFSIDLAVVHGWWKYNGAGNYSEEIKVFNYFISGAFRF